MKSLMKAFCDFHKDKEKEIKAWKEWGESLAEMECCINYVDISLIRRLMLVPGIDLNKQCDGGWTAPMRAADHEREDCLQLFFASGLMDFNLQNNVGLTVLHLVVQYKLINTLRIMKHYEGIDWNLTNINGESALSKALQNNDLEAVKIILSIPSIEIDANSLMSSLGEGSMECPVCLIPFTAQRRVFQCGNGHFTCGDCKGNIQVKSFVSINQP